MKQHGGFEGNAQTLRILTRLEKKDASVREAVDECGSDIRTGLGLTYRTIASILKYDECIPSRRSASAPVRKGYYETEAPLVQTLRSAIAPECTPGRFKTIECSIMDLADDIAYSTYDLEDAFKSSFLSPASMASAESEFKQRIAHAINIKMKHEYGEETY